jgi:MEDS: MEthanogen/methylotroph, DcmR Sensory domain
MPSVLKVPTNQSFVPFRGSRCPELLRLYQPESAQHFVQFYENESLVIENVSFLAAKALATGDSCLLVATESHLEQIQERLAASVLSLDALRKSNRYVAADAAEMLSRFMVGSCPDKAKFDDVIGAAIRTAAKNSASGFVFAFGEMVALLCAAINPDAAIRLEQLWNSLAERHRFSLYCAYSLSSLGSDPDADAVIKICAEHALTIPMES